MSRWLPWLLAGLLLAEAALLAAGRQRGVAPPLPTVRFGEGEAEAALQAHYRKALAAYRMGRDPADLLAIADLLMAYGHHVDAARLYRQVARDHAPRPQAWLGLAMCLDSLGDQGHALEAYRTGIAADPAEPLLRAYQHRIGELLQVRGDLVAARSAYAANRGHPPSRCRLIRLLLRAGERGPAAAEFDLLVADPGIAAAMEPRQLNDLSLRLYGEEIRPLPPAMGGGLLFTQQPADLQQMAIEDRYGITATDLIAERIGEVAAAAGPGDAAVDIPVLVADPRASERGRALFLATSCAACHGLEAFGALGPNLRDDFWLGDGTVTGIVRTIAQGRPGSSMPGHGSLLRADQIRDIAAFLTTLNRGTAKQDGCTATGQPPQGNRHEIADR